MHQPAETHNHTHTNTLPHALTHTHIRTINNNDCRTLFLWLLNRMFGNVGSMTTCVLLFTVVLLIVSLSFLLRPPAAQERQGAVLVLTSPLVTLTSHYQIQLVSGPAPLLKQRVPLSPYTLHPRLSTPFSLLLASPASIQPCSRSTCVHHGDKAERGREGKREGRAPLSIIVLLLSLLLISFPLSLRSLLV